MLYQYWYKYLLQVKFGSELLLAQLYVCQMFRDLLHVNLIECVIYLIDIDAVQNSQYCQHFYYNQLRKHHYLKGHQILYF